MQVHHSPSRTPLTRAHGTGLGLADFSFESFGNALAKVAPSIAQIYTTKANLDTQVALARAQTQYGMAAPGTLPGQAGYLNPSYMAASARPAWMLPALLAGGVGVLALVLMRR